MIIVNYSHPLTPDQQAQIEAMTTDRPAERVQQVTVQMDNDRPFGPQIEALIEATGLTAKEWQTKRLVVVLPSFNFATAGLLAHLHGILGYFPDCVRLRPVVGVQPLRFEVVEIMKLYDLRKKGQEARFK